MEGSLFKINIEVITDMSIYTNGIVDNNVFNVLYSWAYSTVYMFLLPTNARICSAESYTVQQMLQFYFGDTGIMITGFRLSSLSK